MKIFWRRNWKNLVLMLPNSFYVKVFLGSKSNGTTEFFVDMSKKLAKCDSDLLGFRTTYLKTSK